MEKDPEFTNEPVPSLNLLRIPNIQKLSAVNKVMSEAEVWSKLSTYAELCQLYANASCELSRRARKFPKRRIRACELLEPYINDILEQMDAVIAIFAMEKELRKYKGMRDFTMPNL